VIDGEFLSEQPLNALAHGAAANLEVIIGANRDECAFWPLSPEALNVPSRECLGHKIAETQEEVVGRMVWEIAGMPGVLRSQPQGLRAYLERLFLAYDAEYEANPFDLGENRNSSSPLQWLQDTMISDFAFVACAHLISERLACPGNAQAAYRYQFNGYGGQGDAVHGAELELLLSLDTLLIALTRFEWFLLERTRTVDDGSASSTFSAVDLNPPSSSSSSPDPSVSLWRWQSVQAHLHASPDKRARATPGDPASHPCCRHKPQAALPPWPRQA